MHQDLPRPHGRTADIGGSTRNADSATAPVSAVHAVPLAQLHPWPENPRSIRPERLDDLKQALQDDPEMLTVRPLLALPAGTVVCGNQRLRAARELGWQTIPVITVDLDPQRARLWALRDNNAYGDWNDPQLAELLAEPMLRNSSRRGEAVLDPFAGSGSTLIACEQLGRRCFAVELDPGYCDVIRHRYQQLARDV